MKTLPLLMIAGFLSLSLAACNTVEGVGEDLQTLGKGVENTAENAK